ncbi:MULTISPECIES: CapA family protein [unclassified Streptomyces]|uniref:CapA family protein n=1 Tax=unclassified Streptomyces TaxID=2593676 RepID=UPI00088D2250|nr:MULTISPECIES: CapA family protein [unclassified Streptomyces]PBC80679.1 poly-gamma-glutamate synthesis protein (capsule biosynthesis protein) [Streptomyces sp. 2321.6]SDR57673.1 poly-gamma-glutamate synthesis protein (capsule biosynthesis protein) [Streptomyces sp. KS_16]SEB84290.1 poly-gamma-glutamate synthesis protein (capsule biosynthesis protein) [Streptomyces sp. 2133.1]SNC61620.1 poly-gamma-glutamate synthesis protein (capsule biosynthesis protein) [Streptomyces sp. 2114.4]
MGSDVLTLFFCGDVMLGRGVDQILPHPGDPALREGYVRDARVYVELAEAANGPIDRPVDFSWPWGEALRVLDEAAPAARVLNLETSITQRGDFAGGKEIHYRMSPANVPCLTAARPDVCVLANNHVLDFGHQGLADTLDALAGAGLRTAGAGADADAADRPASVPLEGGRRLLVFSFGMPSSGIPRPWAAAPDRAGVAFVARPSSVAATAITDRVRQRKRPGDIAVASVHWGANWGYHVPRDEAAFARTLIDGGVDLVHGHSSHHPRALDVYRGKLVIHGCGDFIDDYEGITGYEQYRDDLRLLYLVSVDPDTGGLHDVRITPLQAWRMRLRHASHQDTRWLRQLLDRISSGFHPCVASAPEGTLTLRPAQGSGRGSAGRPRP